MKILDLFSGIGGFSLGLERAGMTTVAFCEIEDYPRRVLEKHWPGVPKAKDIRQLKYLNGRLWDGSTPIYTGAIDLVCGGFPCQPYSVAGKRGGFKDDRDLWPEMRRLIYEVRPRWVIGENVAGFINMGLERTLSDLEGLGYETQAFVIPACAVGAPHRRDRVWIVGNANELQLQKHGICKPELFKQPGEDVAHPSQQLRERGGERAEQAGPAEPANGGGHVADTPEQQDRGILQPRIQANAGTGSAGSRGDDGCKTMAHAPISRIQGNGTAGEQEPQVYAVQKISGRNGAGGRAGHWSTEPCVGRLAHGIPRRVDRLKGLGNAVVPQIPEVIGRMIMQIESGEA